jgi:hypothetical protein
MAIHLLDPTFQALNLGGRPVKVESQGPPPHPHSGPTHMTTRFTFPARKDDGELSVYWYEGATKPRADIAAKLPMNGSLFVGSKGEISIEHGQQPRLLGEAEAAANSDGKDATPFSGTHHHQQWITACKTGSATGSNFGYAGPFTEVVLLGNVAYRVGRRITYNPVDMSTGDKEADVLLRKDYRKGWEVS